MEVSEALGCATVPLMHQLSAEKGQDFDRWSNGDWKRASLALCQPVKWGGQSTERSWRGSEEDNPQAVMKAAAVGVKAWHCRGFLLLCCGYQQKSANPESWVKWGADRLVPFLWSVSQRMFWDIQLEVKERRDVCAEP